MCLGSCSRRAAHGGIVLRGLHPPDLERHRPSRSRWSCWRWRRSACIWFFFLHLTTAPDNTNNVLALAFGVLIVALIIGGSVWIMGHLNDRMMPSMNQMMQMQR